MTLIEAILVILLLSAAAASSIVYLDSDFIARRQASIAVDDIAQTIQQARNTATLHQTKVVLSRGRGAGNGQLKITRIAGPISDEHIFLIDLEPGVSVTGSPTSLVFDPVGSADRELNWAVSHGGAAGKLHVAPVSGKITKSKP